MRMRIRSHEQPRTSTHEELLPAGRSDESSDAGAHAMCEREREMHGARLSRGVAKVLKEGDCMRMWCAIERERERGRGRVRVRVREERRE